MPMPDALTLTIKVLTKKFSQLEETLNSHIQGMKSAMSEMRSEMRSEMKEVMAEMKQDMPDLNKVLESVKGKDSEVPGPKPIAGVDYPIPENGKDYVLTADDKKEIASKIKVPIVEKVIEKIEVIKEQPIVKNSIFYVMNLKKAPLNAEKGDIIITEDTGEIYIYD